MNAKQKLSYAVMTILSAHTAVAWAADDTGPEPTNTVGAAGSAGTELGEIIVTAQRRAESEQNVPIAIQTLTGETLKELNVATFEEYVKYLPNVTFGGQGPGQENIYMRGLSTGSDGAQGSGTTDSFPNVALYLDDQSTQLPDRNLDIYAVDLERIEILEGPQGTLFGAGAEAGVIRYITNKPKIDVTEGDVNAGYGTTAHGDPSSNVNAVLNIPVVPGALAARVVVYNDARGGYINNLPATFSRASVDRVVVDYFGGVVPPNSGPLNNYAEAGRAINPVTYQGVRGSLLWQLSDDWNALITQTYQSIDADGVFWEEQYDGLGTPLPPLSVETFNPNYDRDRFENTSWTVNGRISALKLVYTGSYLDRTVDNAQDYTNYSRGTFAGYYQCNYPGYPFVGGQPTPGPFKQSNTYPGVGVSPGYCYSPSAYWVDREKNTHQSHELRLSTPDDWRFRGLAGLFWEEYKIADQTDWYYGTSPNFNPIGPPTVNPTTGASLPATCGNCSVRQVGDVFLDDTLRGYRQRAAFASLDFDIIPKTLTITAGTRYYDTQNFELGSSVGSFGCEINGPYDSVNANTGAPFVPPNPCISTPANYNSGGEYNPVLSNLNNLDAKSLHKTYVGFRSRANISWHVARQAMLYYTWSQGYRPGGFNLAQAVIRSGPLTGIWKPPIAYDPDTLTNNEVGWKTEWFDHHLRWNGAVYQENWDRVQIHIFDPAVTGDLGFNTNGPNYRVRGVETSLVWRPLQPLTIQGSASWNSSDNVKNASFNNAAGQPIPLNPNPFGALGSPLANSPPFQANLRARYEWRMANYDAFWQAGGQHQAHSYAGTNPLMTTLQGVPTNFDDPGFTTYSASAGVGKGRWSAQLYADNLTDVRATLFSSYSEYVKMNTINRPRTIGLKFSYTFGEGQ